MDAQNQGMQQDSISNAAQDGKEKLGFIASILNAANNGGGGATH